MSENALFGHLEKTELFLVKFKTVDLYSDIGSHEINIKHTDISFIIPLTILNRMDIMDNL